jgi:hypothetical protein
MDPLQFEKPLEPEEELVCEAQINECRKCTELCNGRKWLIRLWQEHKSLRYHLKWGNEYKDT